MDQKEGVRIMEQGSPQDSRSSITPDVVAVNGTLMDSNSVFDFFRASASGINHSGSMEDNEEKGLCKSSVLCRKSQAVVASSPVNVFLALMSTVDGGYFWPKSSGSRLKVQLHSYHGTCKLWHRLMYCDI